MINQMHQFIYVCPFAVPKKTCIQIYAHQTIIIIINHEGELKMQTGK